MPRRKTRQEFISQAQEQHGNKYDYSQVEYKNSFVKVVVGCPIHGNFTIAPQDHLKSEYGCQKCGKLGGAKKLSILKTCSTGDFIKKCKDIHGDKYDYSKVEYTGKNKKVIIICPDHGEFLMRGCAHIHTQRQGCPKCGDVMRYLCAGREDFIKQAQDIHGDKYDYSLVETDGKGDDKIKIVCPVHGEYEQSVVAHLGRHKSRKEKSHRRLSSEFGVDAPGGCALCGNRRHTTESFIAAAKKIHGDRYDYSQAVWTGYDYKIKIICPVHGAFEQHAGKHIHPDHQSGCKNCGRKISKGETLCREVFKEIFGKDFINVRPSWLINPETGYRLELDGYNEELKMAFEYNGAWHYEIKKYDWKNDLPGIKHRDKIKKQVCEKRGISLFVIDGRRFEKMWRLDKRKKAMRDYVLKNCCEGKLNAA